MDKYQISVQFKKEVDIIINRLLKELECIKLREPECPLLKFPTSVFLFAKTAFFDPVDGSQIIETFLKESFPVWEKIKNRDEKALVDFLLDVVAHNYPIIVSQGMDEIVRNTIDDPHRPVSDSFLAEIWNKFDNLIRLSIQYVHISRCPRKKEDGSEGYTCRFMPDISVKKELEKWGPPRN